MMPFLQRFIPGRAEHVMALKEAYLEKVPITDQERRAKEPNRRKKSVRTKWVDKPFEWTEVQQEAFIYIKEAIQNNAMAGADPDLQYHLAMDASKRATGAVLF